MKAGPTGEMVRMVPGLREDMDWKFGLEESVALKPDPDGLGIVRGEAMVE